MNDKSDWVKRVLGVALSGPPPDPSEPSDLSEADVRQELLARIKEMVIEAKLLPDKEAASRLAALAASATQAVRGPNLMEGELAVARLEEAVGQAKAEARMSEVLAREGLVNWRKAQIEWRAARNRALANVDALTRQVQVDPEILADPDGKEAIALAGQFAGLLPEFDESLEVTLDQLDAETDSERRTMLVQRASSELASYRLLLGAADGLAQLQELSDQEYGGIACYRELELALGKLAKLLAA
jgi:hypothetical protein